MSIRKYSRPIIFLTALVLLIYLARFTDTSTYLSPSSKSHINLNLHQSSQPKSRLLQQSSTCSSSNLISNATYSSFDNSTSTYAQSSLQSLVPGNPLTTLLNSSSSTSNRVTYARAMLPAYLPWLILCLISLLVFIYFLLSWIFIFLCPSCCCCRCCDRPTQVKYRTICTILTILFMTGLVASSIAGLVIASEVPQSTDSTDCAVTATFDSLIHGNPSYNFIGLNAAASSLNTLNSNISNLLNNLNNISTNGLQNVSNAASQLKSALVNFQSTYQNLTVASPAFGVSQPIVPDFISNLGPCTSASTVCGIMTSEVNAKNQTVAAVVSNISSEIQTIDQQASFITSSIHEGADQIQNISDALVSVQHTINNDLSTIQYYSNAFSISLDVLYSVALAFGCIVIGSIIFIQYCKLLTLNCILYLSCLFLCIFTILGFLLTAALFPASVIVSQSCNILSSAIANSSSLDLNQISSGLPANASSYLAICLSGDGDLVTQLTNGNLQILSSLDEKLNQVNPYLQSSNSSNLSVTIPAFKALVEQFISGELPVSSSLDPDDPINATTTLNSLVDDNYPNSQQASDGCFITQDTIQLNSVNCSQNTYIMKTSDPSNINLNTGACIGIADFSNTTNQQKIIDRYSNPNPFATCDSTLSTTIIQDYTALTGHYNDVKNKFTQMIDDSQNGFANLTALDNNLDAQMRNLTQPFQSLQSSAEKVLEMVSDPNQGLIQKLNCSVIGASAKNVYNSMCIGLLSALYQSALVLAIASCFGLISVCLLFNLAKKYTALKDAIDTAIDVKKFAPIKSRV